jgi:hypothetical protein
MKELIVSTYFLQRNKNRIYFLRRIYFMRPLYITSSKHFVGVSQILLNPHAIVIVVFLKSHWSCKRLFLSRMGTVNDFLKPPGDGGGLKRLQCF